MKRGFTVEAGEGRAGRVLKLCRQDGLVLMTQPDDASGQRRIDDALRELDDHQGAWLSLSGPMVPEWGRRFASFLEKVRHNDWTFSPGTVLSQWYTEGHINKGIPLKDVPEVYSLWGNLNEYSCLAHFLILDPEALELVEDLVPPSGNRLDIDRFVRLNADHVARVSRLMPGNWHATMHWGPEVRSPVPELGVMYACTGTRVYGLRDHLTAIVRGDLSATLPETRHQGTAILQALCPRSYDRMMEFITGHASQAA